MDVSWPVIAHDHSSRSPAVSKISLHMNTAHRATETGHFDQSCISLSMIMKMLQEQWKLKREVRPLRCLGEKWVRVHRKGEACGGRWIQEGNTGSYRGRRGEWRVQHRDFDSESRGGEREKWRNGHVFLKKKTTQQEWDSECLYVWCLDVWEGAT